MAAVLDAFAPYIKKLIQDMALEEVSLLLGVSSEITKLEDNMESLKAFIVDAERRRIADQSVRRWVRKLKDAMYDATDILDVCQLEADKHRESKGGGSRKQKVTGGCFQPLRFCLHNPVFAHKIGSQIKELNQQLEGIYREADRFKFNIGIGSSNPELRRPASSERAILKMTSEFDESAVVGEKIEKETRDLAQMLVCSSDHDIKVVSIVGTGGMGKTTLAQKVFNDRTMQKHFKLKIWLSITQHFDEAELLRTAIKHAGGHYDWEQEKTLLTRNLTSTLSKGRFLLVMDDVWSDEAWSHVLRTPIKNASQRQPGNWVLITTRFQDLAHKMGASFYQHHVSPLNQEEAWSLLNKQLPPPPLNQVARTDHLEVVGMKIVRRCGGLPLAVKVMGGLLSTRCQSEREWEAVLRHRAWSIDGLPKELDNRIYLSYEDLSPQLKQCFLYCSLFPKGTSIWQHIIVPMWISEGFIQLQDGSSSHDDGLEEIAIEYYRELITRNLIEPTEDSCIDKYSCTMHDVVRSFAEFMAKEDSLVVQYRQDVGGSNDSRVRRMSIGSSKSGLDWAVLQKQEALRTLIINCKINFEPGDSLISFARLRVLSIKGGDCDWLVGSLCHLRHLRYFCLVETNISRLPENIHMMKFLQHIIIRWSADFRYLPRTVIKLVHLRTLDIYGSNANVVIPKGFGGLTNLRMLLGFPVHMDMDGDASWCSLEEIGPLLLLRKLSLHGLENVAASSLAEMAMVSSKEHLDYLELNWSSSRCLGLRDKIEKQQQQRVAEEVLEKLCPPSSIQHLHIEEYFGRHLPNWMMVHATCAFKSLRLLMLKDLPCCTQLPHGLCRLPSLEAMQIVDAPAVKRVGPEFQASTSLTAAVAFPYLTALDLEGLCGWEEWDWAEYNDKTADTMAMPSLKGLTIKSCKLSCLPPGLASSKRHALRTLDLYEMANLTSVENFPSVVELDVFDCPKLEKISGLCRLQKIRIAQCPNLQVLEGLPTLDSMTLEDATMETLPEYLTAVNLRYLELYCSKMLHESLSMGSSSGYKNITRIKSRHISYMPEDEYEDED